MRVFDHTEASWSERRKDKMNGAYTYSKEIITYQLPLWEPFLPEDAVISTAPLLPDVEEMPRHAPVYIQYLHHPYLDLRKLRVLANIYHPTIFVTAYRWLDTNLHLAGLRSLYLPMTIDTSNLPKGGYSSSPGRIVYFGNLTAGKRAEYRELQKVARYLGWRIDTISKGRVGKRRATQEEIWYEIVANYSYGIGVGRCALELLGMGIKTIISGRQFGGILLNKGDFSTQLQTNLNGMYTTGVMTIEEAFKSLPQSLLMTNSIQSELPFIKDRIRNLKWP